MSRMSLAKLRLLQLRERRSGREISRQEELERREPRVQPTKIVGRLTHPGSGRAKLRVRLRPNRG